jgi:2-amino-4-hydroxy-6-hydroxymethyldihydropteridine diphosphokinase
MAKVYLALGSNVGNGKEYLLKAYSALQKNISNCSLAPIYTSKAVGYINQPNFTNSVMCGDTDLSSKELLRFVKKIEKDLGRIERFRWGPREIDIDIIFYDNLVMIEQGLTIPHASFRERDFVLIPLIDLNPGLVDPKSGLTIQQIYNSGNNIQELVLNEE